LAKFWDLGLLGVGKIILSKPTQKAHAHPLLILRVLSLCSCKSVHGFF